MFTFCPERPSDHPFIETLLDTAFGENRHSKASYRLREGQVHNRSLSHVVLDQEQQVVGTVRFWPVAIRDLITGDHLDALLLGPVAIDPALQKCGLGAKLMEKALSSAENQGHQRILLVGDVSYYGRFGFLPVLPSFITLPGGKDARRLLVRQPAYIRSLPAVGRVEPVASDKPMPIMLTETFQQLSMESKGMRA